MAGPVGRALFDSNPRRGRFLRPGGTTGRVVGPATGTEMAAGSHRPPDQSGGEGLFLMAEKTVDGKDVRSQLMEKIGL